MSKSKHTPGPWKHVLAVVSNAPSVHVVTTGQWGAPNIAVVDSEANARLIACAPELLEALKFLIDHRGMMGSSSWAVAERAIAKAEGRE